MGIEDELQIIQQQLSRIGDLIGGLVKDKEKNPENISEEKDSKKPEPKKEMESNEEILYTCTNCGVSFAKGEQHSCKIK